MGSGGQDLRHYLYPIRLISKFFTLQLHIEHTESEEWVCKDLAPLSSDRVPEW